MAGRRTVSAGPITIGDKRWIDIMSDEVTDYKQTEEARQEIEERYRRIVENTGEAIVIIQEGRVVFANARLSELYGYPSDEVLGRSFTDFIHPDDLPRIIERYNKRLAGELQERITECRLMDQDGAERWTEFNSDRIQWEGRTAILTLFRDITDRKQAEEALQEAQNLLETRVRERTAELEAANARLEQEVRERRRAEEALAASREQFKVVVQGSPLTMAAIDQDGRLEILNDKFTEMLGYGPEDIPTLDRWWTVAYPDEDYRQKVKKVTLRAIADARATEGLEPTREWKVTTKDGAVLYIQFHSRRIDDRTLFILVDVTKRRRVEEALTASREELKAVVEGSPLAMTVADEKGNLEILNEKFTEMLGYEPSEVPTLDHWWPLAYPDENYRQMVIDAVQKAKTESQAAGRPAAREWKVTCKDGAVLDVQFYSTTIGDKTLFIFVDVTERRRVEEALRSSEERYRHLVEDSFDGIFIQKGPKIIFANQQLSEMLGYEPGELEGLDHWLIYHPDFQELVRTRAQARLRGEVPPPRYEVKLQRKDGSSFDGEVSARAFTVEGEPGIRVWVRDISEGKRAEEKLRESEERYRFLAENMADIVWTMDLNFQTTYVSPSIKKVLGFTPEERKHQTLDEMLTPDSQQRSLEHLMEQLQLEDQGADPERTLSVEVQYYRRDGSTVWMENSLKALRDEAGVMIGMYGTSRDITARKQAEEALRASEASYRSLFENSPVSLWEVDFSGVMGYLADLSNSGVTDFQAYFEAHPEAVTHCARLSRVTDVNQATLTMYGAETKEEIREAGRDVYTAESWAAFVRTLTAVAQGEKDFEIATSSKTLTGERRDIILRSAAIPGQEGLTDRILVSNTDITARKAAEQERERLIGELQEALVNIKTLHGLIPICANCKKIRDDKGYWQQVEVYVRDHSEAEFSHGICPECMAKLYPNHQKE